MSRFAVAFVAVAGCYSPGTGTCAISCETGADCPSSLVCATSGRCGETMSACAAFSDAPFPDDDAPGLDGPPLVLCSPSTSFTVNPMILPITGRSFSTTFDRKAMFDDGVIEESDADGSMVHTTMFTTTPTEVLTHPMIDPTGGDAFFLGNTTHTLQRAKAEGAKWAVPVAVGTAGLAIDNLTRLGQPSATNPRRICVTTSAVVQEGVEQAPGGDWAFIITHDFGGIQALSSPSLSSDGLTLMFIGKTAAGPSEIYVAMRTLVTDVFVGAVVYVNDPAGQSNETDVAIAPDCSAVFVSANNTVVKLH